MFLVVFTIVIAAVLYEFLYNKKQKDAARKLPGPRCLPFIGNVHQVTGNGSDLYKVMTKFYEKYGRRFRIFIGANLFIFFSKADDVEIIMSSSVLIEKSDEYEFFYKWLGTGLLTSGGTKWRTRRKMITPAFHFKIVESFVPIFEKNSDPLIRKMSNCQDKGEVDIFPLINLYALDVISESAMGVSVKAQEQEFSEYVNAVKDISKIILMRMKSAFYRFDPIFKFSNESKIHDRALDVLHSYTDKMIRERKVMWENNEINMDVDSYSDYIGSKKKMAFMDLLLQATIDGEKLDHASIREEVDTFLFEGHDTTTSGISFALYSIAGHTDVQNKLYEEQKQIFGDDLSRRITYADLQNMKYLEIVIKEVLRLYPSVPFVARKAANDTQISDVIVPAGTTIAVNIVGLHRDPEVFEDPLKFNPERFSADNCRQRNPYSYIAFSAGPRNCIGQRFAMLEMKAVLSKILRNFKLAPGSQKPDLSADIILTSNSGVYIKITKR